MEYKDFETLEDLAESSSAEACYVAYDTMVFDVTETLDEMDNVFAGDCGKDLTPQFTKDEGDVFYNLNIDNFVGSVLSELPTVEEGAYQYTEGEEEMEPVVEEVTPVASEFGSTMSDPVSIGILGVLFVAIVVVVAVLVSSMKKEDKKKVEVKKEGKGK